MPRVLPLLLPVVLVLAACGADTAEPAPAEPAANTTPEALETPAPEPELEVRAGEGLTVVATIFPLAWMAEQVAPGADHTFLGVRGQDPHDLELSPMDRANLEAADVVLYMGDLDFQPQVEAAIADAAGEVVDAADVAGEQRLIDLDDDHAHEDEDDHDHGHADEGDDDHAHEGYDPHLWFDAGIMADVAGRIGEAFAAADPEGAERYREHAGDLVADLDRAGDDIAARFASCARDVAIVSHEAYAYLLEPHDLEQEGISGAGGHGEASPQRLAELTARIDAEQVPAILAEPVEGRADAEALAAETGVPLVEINPLEVVTDAEYEAGYVTLLRDQAEAFATALECSR